MSETWLIVLGVGVTGILGLVFWLGERFGQARGENRQAEKNRAEMAKAIEHQAAIAAHAKKQAAESERRAKTAEGRRVAIEEKRRKALSDDLVITSADIVEWELDAKKAARELAELGEEGVDTDPLIRVTPVGEESK